MPFSLLHPVPHLQAVREIAGIVRARRQLLWEMVKRELTEKHAGQALGAMWVLGHPVILMLVYVMIFGVIFRARIDQAGLSIPLDYTVYILAGLAPWLTFQEAMNKGTVAIVSNANLVKQVVFPVEVLPVKTVIASMFTMTVLLVLLLAYAAARFGALHPTVLLIPVLMFFQMLAMAGVAFVLSAVGTYLRDLREVVTIFALINVYLMPVVYLPDWVPPMLRPLLYANPFSYMTWCYQDAIFYGRIEHPVAWVVFPLFSMACFVLGYRAFRMLKPYFGNVL